MPWKFEYYYNVFLSWLTVSNIQWISRYSQAIIYESNLFYLCGHVLKYFLLLYITYIENLLSCPKQEFEMLSEKTEKIGPNKAKIWTRYGCHFNTLMDK